MINHNIKLLALGLILLLAYSCKEDILGEGEVTTITPTPNVWVESQVVGLVEDESGQPLSNVEVDHIGSTFMTDDNGYFTVPARSTTLSGGYITFSKAGFYENSKFFVQTDPENYSFLKVTMLSLGTAQVIDASIPNELTIDNDLARIEFKANSFVDENGNAYSGDVSVYSKYIDPIAADLAERMPGDLRAIDVDGARVQLSTFGMLATELRGESGQELQIASESSAIIKMLIPDEIAGSITPTIPVWSFDESNGYWVEESEASQTSDGYYTAEVAHFSYWNYDAPWPIVRFCGRFTYESGEPLAHAKVTVVIVDSGACKSAWTDSTGKVCGDVPKNQPLEIIVMDECGNVVYQEVIGSFDEPFDLDITVPIITAVTVVGTLTCNGNPVTNGYAYITNDELIRFVAPTDDNGNFSLAFNDCNSTSRVTVQGFDLDEPAVGEVEIRDITSEVITFMLDVCTGEPEDEFITLDISGSQRLFTEPTAKLINGTDLHLSSNSTASPDSIIEFATIRISDAFQGANNIVSAIGGFTGQNSFSCEDSSCANDFSVNLVQYGTQIGAVIEGSYDGTIQGPNGEDQIISGTFRIILDELCNTASISGRFYLDDNDNGLYDTGENLVEGGVELINQSGGFTDIIRHTGEFSLDNVRTQTNYSIFISHPGYEIAGPSSVDLNCQGITIDQTSSTSVFLLEDMGINCLDIPLKKIEFDCASAVSVQEEANSCTGESGQLQIVNSASDLIIFEVLTIDGVDFNASDPLFLEGNSIGRFPIEAGVLGYTITDEDGNEICSDEITMTSNNLIAACEIFPETSCNGTDFVFEVVEYWCPNFNFTEVLWSDGSTGFFSTTVEGNYSGFFTDDAGCQGQVDFEVDFSEFKSVSGIVWQDSPSGIDGVLQNGESRLSNTEVRLYLESDPSTPIDIVLTNGEGEYLFENLNFSTNYLISIDLPVGFEYSPSEVGTDFRVSSKADEMTGLASYILVCDANYIFDYTRSLHIGIKEI